MDKRTRYAIASGAALLLSLGGAAVLAGPAIADAVTTHPAAPASGHEDGTADGETADDATEAPGTEQADANEGADTETADDAGGAVDHEDGTADGETADDAGSSR